MMSPGTAIEWIAVLLFLLLFAGMTVAEILWLIKQGWASSGKAAAYVLITNLLAFGIGTVVIMSAFMAAIIMLFGPAGRGSDAPEAAYWAALAVGVLVPPVTLFLLKRVGLALFKMRSGKTAWTYSLAISFIIFAVVLIPPPLILYIVITATGWK